MDALDAMDGALALLEGCGPEFGAGLANHGPMGAEALCVLGRAQEAEAWTVRYRKRLGERPANIARITAGDWREALGDVPRVSDWDDFLTAEFEQAPWPEVLETWALRLLPGVMSGATHGFIRTAHAVRALAARENPARRAELVAGLAYWAARYQVLPGVLADATVRLPSEAIELLPIMPPQLRDRRPANIFTAVAELDEYPPFAEAVNLAVPGDDLSAFLSDLTATMAARYLQNAGPASIAYVHTVTAPSALRMLVPHLSPGTARLAARYAWQACAAIHSRSHYPHAVELPEPLPTREEMIDRAVSSGDEHAIKFTEACLREYALRPELAFLAGPIDVSARYGRHS